MYNFKFNLFDVVVAEDGTIGKVNYRCVESDQEEVYNVGELYEDGILLECVSADDLEKANISVEEREKYNAFLRENYTWNG